MVTVETDFFEPFFVVEEEMTQQRSLGSYPTETSTAKIQNTHLARHRTLTVPSPTVSDGGRSPCYYVNKEEAISSSSYFY